MDLQYAQLKAELGPNHPNVAQQKLLAQGLRSVFKIAADRHTYLTLRADHKGTELEGVAEAVDLKLQHRARTGRYISDDIAQDATDYTQQYIQAKRKELLKVRLQKERPGKPRDPKPRAPRDGGGGGGGRNADSRTPAAGGAGNGERPNRPRNRPGNPAVPGAGQPSAPIASDQ